MDRRFLGVVVSALAVVMVWLMPVASRRAWSADGHVTPAACGPGSLPETALQGEVPNADRLSGRSKLGYRCNLALVGQYQGEGASWVDPSYRDCVYNTTDFYSGFPKKSPGVQVIDVSQPASPVLSTNLTSPAMLIGTWESLKVNEARGLLGGVSADLGSIGFGGTFFDLYDIGHDCKHPKLLNPLVGNLTIPINVLSHEGGWSADGNTYWSSGVLAGSLTAIDTRDLAHPKIVYAGSALIPTGHGFSLSADGNRLYLTGAVPSGVVILDVSDVQSRKPFPSIKTVGSLFWSDGGLGISQQTLPVTYQGKPYLFVIDEAGSKGIHVVDISDETHPREVAGFNLEIQRPEHADVVREDILGHDVWDYEAHYCSVDRSDDPTALACGFFNSGVRVFDIRDFNQPREIAYYNPPAQTGKKAQLPGSKHGTGSLGLADYSADLCTSPPRFVGNDQLWATCLDNGFMALKFTNGVYPIAL